MECKKCKKQVPDDALFCPYCGTRTVKNHRGNVLNRDYMTICRDDDFKDEFERLKALDYDSAREWFRSNHEQITVYSAVGIVRPERMGSYKVCLDAEKLKSLIYESYNAPSGSPRYKMKSVELVCDEKILVKSDFDKIGSTVFWTKEECQVLLSELGKILEANCLSK